MLRKTLCVLLLSLLGSACASGFTTEETVGVLQLTHYFESRPLCWEGTCSHLVKSKLCVATTKACLEQKDFQIDRPSDSPEAPARWAMVVGHTDLGESADTRSYRFYDTRTGQRLSCRNCPFDLEGRLAAAAAKFEWRDAEATTSEPMFKSKWQQRTQWSHDSSAMVVVLPGATAGGATVSLLSFDPQGITWRDIGSAAMRESGLSDFTFSPDDRTLVWQSCTPRCALWTYERSSGTQSQRDIHCAQSNSIQIAWEGARARVHHDLAQCPVVPG